MAEVSAAGERFQAPDSGRATGLSAIQTLVVAMATIVLSVLATSVAVGTFLWLATEARIEATEARIEATDTRIDSVEEHVVRLDNRLARVEERLTVLETEVKGINERLKAVEEGLRRIENILLYRQGAAVPMAPGAGEP